MNEIRRPMLASLVDAPLTDPQLIYEPKYDGIRAIVEIDGARVRLWSRLGNEKTAQFPEVVAALTAWARRRREPLVLDGEIVALDKRGRPTGFQQLQGRIHLSRDERDRAPSSSSAQTAPAAFIAFDVLREGQTDLRDRPLVERRQALERIVGEPESPLLRLSETVRGDGRALYKRALANGWEGLIAKHADSRYKSGKRTPDWRKLKIVHEQEFVVGGWTEPRQTRTHFGALLLGVYDGGRLVYVGSAGTGFDERELARLMKRLTPLAVRVCPFRDEPKLAEPAHWVEPALVAQVKFTEWTVDGKLRHPVYLGLRDDKRPADVHRERVSRLHETSKARLNAPTPVQLKPNTGQIRLTPDTGEVRLKPDTTYGEGVARSNSAVVSGSSRTVGVSRLSRTDATRLLEQMTEIERSRRDGVLLLPGGDQLTISNLHKVFWPRQNLTKGDLLRYYVQAASFLLPAVQDRPLTMKRFPNGITGQTFYQHRAPDAVPSHVRAEHVPGDDAVPMRLIGGNLNTLLYMVQLAAISQDPWFSRIATPDVADHVAFDLDPADGVPFDRVLDVARWIRDELASLGATGVPKTSGADGLHVYIPLPPRTPYEAGLLFCQIVATVVAQRHPAVATIERSVKARGRRVYIDCLQNVQGKTLATAYSARASSYAGVSTPLTWEEVDRGVRREEFTIDTMPARLREVGDLWKALRISKGVDLSRVSKYAAKG